MNRQPLPISNQFPCPLSVAELRRQNRVFANTGGVSSGNRDRGFVPAFIDRDTGMIYPACHRDGRPAPMHILDGLPRALVSHRDAQGRAVRLKASVEAGFLRAGRFFTRSEAARAVT